MEYRPAPSVTADRTFSISAGLETSTVTPGSTAPDVSLTVPAMLLVCADAAAGSSVRSATPPRIRVNVRMPLLPPEVPISRWREGPGYCAALVPPYDAESLVFLPFFSRDPAAGPKLRIRIHVW